VGDINVHQGAARTWCQEVQIPGCGVMPCVHVWVAPVAIHALFELFLPIFLEGKRWPGCLVVWNQQSILKSANQEVELTWKEAV
jgi:hypothetical protein